MNFIRNLIKGRSIFPIKLGGENSIKLKFEDENESNEKDDIEFCRKSNYPRNSCEAQWMLVSFETKIIDTT